MSTAGYMMGISSLMGGYTSHNTMSPAFNPTPPGMPTGAPGLGMLLRGHGFVRAGLQYVEGPPTFEPKGSEVNKSDEAEKIHKKKKRECKQSTLLLVGIMATVIAVTFGVLWFNGIIGPGARESQGGNDWGTRTVPAVVDASGGVTGWEIRLTRTNPDSQPTDSYLVEMVDVSESEARYNIDESNIIPPLKEERIYVKVVLRRVKGQVSGPV